MGKYIGAASAGRPAGANLDESPPGDIGVESLVGVSVAVPEVGEEADASSLVSGDDVLSICDVDIGAALAGGEASSEGKAAILSWTKDEGLDSHGVAPEKQ